MSAKKRTLSENQLIHLARLARGLEANGFYNSAKVCWAAAYSEEIRASLEQGIPTSQEELDREIGVALAYLEAQGVQPEVTQALAHGRQAVRENKITPYTEIPDVYVCRKCGTILLDAEASDCTGCGASAITLRNFPPVYFMEAMNPSQAIASLASAIGELEDIITPLNEGQLAQSPRSGEWSIREAILHLLVSEELLSGRLKKILAEDDPDLIAVAAWDLDENRTMSTRLILNRFRISRQATLKLLAEIQPTDWWRTAFHEEFGKVTLLEQVSYFAKHERDHWRQIYLIRQALGA
jgi:rubrerythrin/uncharacterized damage-inducible protein DinB